MTGVTQLWPSRFDQNEFQIVPDIRNTGLWRSNFLTEAERFALEQAATPPKRFEGHRDIICEADKAENLLLVTSGWVCRYTCAPDGGRQVTALLVPGDIANLDSLLFSRVTYTVRTLTPATIVALPRSRALALVDEYPGIARAFTALAIIETAIASKWMLSLGRRSAHGRIAHLLCEIVTRLGVKGEKDIIVPFPLRQEQVGDVLGLTAVHVNRMIRQLRGEGLIDISDRGLRVCDLVALRHAAGFDPAYLQMNQYIDAATRSTPDVA
jgi:CRP-like cAMP-binding protein